MHKLNMSERLQQLTKKAIAPLSGFLVASIVIDKNGNEYKGVNIEYEVPTNSICAERNALLTAFTNGVRMGEILEVHIIAYDTNNPNEDFVVTPCGACRQAINEASNKAANVFMYNLKGDVKSMSISDLLPASFDGVGK